MAVFNAQAWLDGRSPDFKTVCTLAGRDPDAVWEWWQTIKSDPEKIKAVRLSMRDVA